MTYNSSVMFDPLLIQEDTLQYAQPLVLSALFFLGSFVLGFALTPVFTYFAYKYKWWKRQRELAVTGETAPVFKKLHKEKHRRNIPTMAGTIMIFVIGAVTILFNLDRNQTWLPLASLLMFGAFGFWDDITNVFLKKDKRGGLTPTTQILGLLTLSLAGAWWFYYKLGYDGIHVPGVGDFGIGWFYLPLFVLVVFATSKAVSITDGLDGLSGGLLSMAFGSYGVIAFFQGNLGIAAFCATVVGAVLAYTWFNIYPARFFMGQTGSTALGATLGVVALLTDSVFVLPIIGLVFVLEAGSSLLQIFSKKVLGKKIFLSAPIHHHFEAMGWPETKVTMRFWIVGALAGVFGTIIGLLGGG